MLPLLKDGNFVFGLKYLLTSPKVGDVVVFNHSVYGLCIKKVIKYSKTEKKLCFEGLNKSISLKPEDIGSVPLKDVRCKVLRIF